MKKLLIAGAFTSAFFIVAGCSDESEQGNESHTPHEAGEGAATETMEVIDVNETEEGTFNVYQQIDSVGSYEIGPLVINVEQVKLGAADLEGYISAFTGDERIDYVQIAVDVENTSNEDVHFSYGHTSMETDAGEAVDVPNVTLSDETDHEFAAGESKEATLLFPIESAEGVNVVSFTMEGPSNQAGEEQTADDLQFSIEFSG